MKISLLYQLVFLRPKIEGGVVLILNDFNIVNVKSEYFIRLMRKIKDALALIQFLNSLTIPEDI